MKIALGCRLGAILFQLIDSWIAVTSLPIVCLAALLFGDQSERYSAIAIFISWLAVMLIESTAKWQFGYLSFMAIDAVLLVFLALIGQKTRKSWLMLAIAFQAIGMFVHACHALDLKFSASAFVIAIDISGYGLTGSLAVGTYIAWREREALKAFGLSQRTTITKSNSTSADLRL